MENGKWKSIGGDDCVKLGEVIEIKKGKKPKEIVAEPLPNYRRLIQIDDLRPNSIPKFCPPANDEVKAVESDVIIAWDGANAATSNFGISGVIGSTLAILRPKSSNLFTPFLGHFLRANRFYLRQNCKGATVPHIDGKTLKELQLPNIELPEQKRIAEVLDSADSLREKRRLALTKLDSLLQSVFLEMFVQDEAWRQEKIENVLDTKKGSIRTGPFGSQLLHSEFTSEGIAVLGIDNVVKNKFTWDKLRFISEQKYKQLKRYTVFPNDVLISIMGTCGKSV